MDFWGRRGQLGQKDSASSERQRSACSKVSDGKSTGVLDTGTKNVTGLQEYYAVLQEDRTSMDINNPAYNISGPECDTQKLESEKLRVFGDIYNQICFQQVSRSKLEFATGWILKNEFEHEHQSNWTETYIQVKKSYARHHPNVVTSLIVYRVKCNEEGDRKLKARMFPQRRGDGRYS